LFFQKRCWPIFFPSADLPELSALSLFFFSQAGGPPLSFFLRSRWKRSLSHGMHEDLLGFHTFFFPSFHVRLSLFPRPRFIVPSLFLTSRAGSRGLPGTPSQGLIYFSRASSIRLFPDGPLIRLAASPFACSGDATFSPRFASPLKRATFPRQPPLLSHQDRGLGVAFWARFFFGYSWILSLSRLQGGLPFSLLSKRSLFFLKQPGINYLSEAAVTSWPRSFLATPSPQTGIRLKIFIERP